jgi:cytochrome c-type biogenesis protein CcmH/NrfG
MISPDTAPRGISPVQYSIASKNSSCPWTRALPGHRRAMAIDPNDADVSTALATALWRSGQTDAALAQLDASLAIDPAHAQTLFTKGVVEADGRHDYEAAVRAWTALLDAHPDYPRAETVRAMIRDTEPK